MKKNLLNLIESFKVPYVEKKTLKQLIDELNIVKKINKGQQAILNPK